MMGVGMWPHGIQHSSEQPQGSSTIPGLSDEICLGSFRRFCEDKGILGVSECWSL